MSRLVLIGVGNAAIAVNNLATAASRDSSPNSAAPEISNKYRYDTIYGTTRQSAKMETLERYNIKPILLDSPLSEETLHQLSQICVDAHVLVSFPPSKDDEVSIAQSLGSARKIVYISSTGVYGATSGIITESSDVEFDNPSIKPRLESESLWSSHGAVILRAPALYGPNYGLHISLKSGKFKIPGDGNRFSSRIHLDDFASIILASLERADKSSLYVVGDDRPATHNEVVTWLCQRLSIDMPESIPIEQAHVTLRANRQINAGKIKSDLNIVLAYPTFIEGFNQCLSLNTEV